MALGAVLIYYKPDTRCALRYWSALARVVGAPGGASGAEGSCGGGRVDGGLAVSRVQALPDRRSVLLPLARTRLRGAETTTRDNNVTTGEAELTCQPLPCSLEGWATKEAKARMAAKGETVRRTLAGPRFSEADQSCEFAAFLRQVMSLERAGVGLESTGRALGATAGSSADLCELTSAAGGEAILCCA